MQSHDEGLLYISCFWLFTVKHGEKKAEKSEKKEGKREENV